MARMPNVPRVPLGVIVGGLGAIGSASAATYLLWNSVYSGAFVRGVVVWCGGVTPRTRKTGRRGP